MKFLYLMRHAEAEQPLLTGDEKRELTAAGIAQAAAAAEWLSATGATFDKIRCSTATRTRQTAGAITSKFNIQQPVIEFDARIYAADTELLLEIIQATEDEVSTLLVIGHNPTLAYLAIAFSQRRVTQMPTAGIAVFEADISTWADLNQARTRLIDFRI